MKPEGLHPSVENFKLFVQKNPSIIQQVRSGRKSWQELYEDWAILGEGHETWQQINEEKTEESKAKKESQSTQTETKNDFMNQVLGYFKKVDMDQVQAQMNNLSSALTTVQGLIGQFTGGNKTGSSSSSSSAKPHPFAFRKD